ncbi:hypothetical protein M433DRAFT_350486 [Acidomyces richmondensis BFW]|nr:MAG: hypothetical protein FE78DRAFT_482182 [Acidomyces sp. 'richmondensis']KYG43555.1 hypothetical protein M433DRAFT_350486 [Acidomyces richmondensis BFW]
MEKCGRQAVVRLRLLCDVGTDRGRLPCGRPPSLTCLVSSPVTGRGESEFALPFSSPTHARPSDPKGHSPPPSLPSSLHPRGSPPCTRPPFRTERNFAPPCAACGSCRRFPPSAPNLRASGFVSGRFRVGCKAVVSIWPHLVAHPRRLTFQRTFTARQQVTSLREAKERACDLRLSLALAVDGKRTDTAWRQRVAFLTLALHQTNGNVFGAATAGRQHLQRRPARLLRPSKSTLAILCDTHQPTCACDRLATSVSSIGISSIQPSGPFN